ncbi:MAG: acetoacetate metabolism regulatory protein AtoC [Nitrospinaceae bacterium]|nr:MAG: acetoacetate metabolism regulatory protein AtoC [Nitrospinaceae bacterium]
MNSILVVDDEKSLRDLLTIMLENEGYEVQTASSGEKAFKLVQDTQFDLVITDFKMKGANGIDVLEAVKSKNSATPVVLMTAYASAETAVEAMKKGAYDYISKPFKVEDLQLIVKNAIEKKNLSDENQYLKSALNEKYGFTNFIGSSQAMKNIFKLIEKVADSNATVLIGGESGTGKELVAKAIHFNGARKNHPFVSVNCGAVPENLLESELFGHEKGAFTSADSTKVGLMETANKGSFFLDEVGETPLNIQVKLLRVLQEKEITRVGGTKSIPIDLRIIAASNLDLTKAAKNKTFREDLYYRLNVIPIELPPLRERREDISLLVDHFIKKYNEERSDNSKIRGVHPDALTLMEKYPWPGNVRELENVIERAVVLETGDMIQVASLPDGITGEAESASNVVLPSADQPVDLEKTLDQIEMKMIRGALDQSNGIINKAAKQLNLSFRSMRYRIQKHKLKGKEEEDD